MQYVLVYQSVVCLKLYIWCNHPPTKTNQPPAFPKPGKITVVAFFQTFLPIFGLYCLCLDVCPFAFFCFCFPCLFVFEAVCLSSCFLFSVCLSLPLCLFICFSAWLSAFCQLAFSPLSSVHQSVDNRFNSTYIGRSMRCKRLNLVLYILHMQPFIPRDPFSPDKPCLFSP